MDIFNPLVEKSKLHYRFKEFIAPQFIKERELLQKWCSGFYIKDGEKKTIKQLQTTFYSVFWEIYLNEVFKDLNYCICEGYSSPDFILDIESSKVCIEAVISNVSDGGRGEEERTLTESLGENDRNKIVNESIIRLYNAVSFKNKKYLKDYIKNEVVRENPFVLAISDYSQANYDQTYIYSMMALLYSAYYDPEDTEELLILCNDSFNREYKYKDKVLKHNGAELKLGLFQNDEYKHLSAIIYTCTLCREKLTSLTINHPNKKFILIDRDISSFSGDEESSFSIHRTSGSKPDEVLADGIFVFHNRFASNPLDENFMKGKGITHIRDNEDEFEIDYYGHLPPLKRRRVGMSGQDFEYIQEMDDFDFFRVPKV